MPKGKKVTWQLSHIVNLWKKPDTITVGDVKINTCYLTFPWINNGFFIHWETDKWKQMCRCIEKKGLNLLRCREFWLPRKINMKNFKSGILMQAEFRVTEEFMSIINKNTLTGLCNAVSALYISFPHDILQFPWNRVYKTNTKHMVASKMKKVLHKDRSIAFLDLKFWVSSSTVFKIYLAFRNLGFYLHIYFQCFH